MQKKFLQRTKIIILPLLLLLLLLLMLPPPFATSLEVAYKDEVDFETFLKMEKTTKISCLVRNIAIY